MVFGIKDVSVKQRLLREEGFTLQKAMDITRTSEASKLQIREMGKPSTTSQVNMCTSKWKRSKKKKQSSQNTTQQPVQQPMQKTSQQSFGRRCRYCGQTHPPKSCPAYGKQCSFCKKTGHFESVCRQKKGGQKNVNAINEEGQGSEDNCCVSLLIQRLLLASGM